MVMGSVYSFTFYERWVVPHLKQYTEDAVVFLEEPVIIIGLVQSDFKQSIFQRWTGAVALDKSTLHLSLSTKASWSVNS